MSLPVDAPLAGRLVRRYKRFLADVELDGGRVVTAHCPDPGRMQGLLRAGNAVRLSTSDDPRRKLKYTLEMIRVARTWVGVHAGRANAIAGLAISAGSIPTLGGYSELRREVPVEPGSRLDFSLTGHADGVPDALLEVKSVTWAENRRGRFPDAVTARGTRHVELLTRLASEGRRTALLFVAQRADCESVEPADEIDPAYGAALRRAAVAGVEILALGTRVSPTRILPTGALPVLL